MVSYLQIENLSKSYGDRFLFSDVTFGVYEGDKIGIVASNGSGKSALLKILCGEEDYDDGRVVWKNDIRIGYLEQSPTLDPERSILENVCDFETDVEKRWVLEDKAKSLLGSFGINDLTQKTDSLSGGQIKRIAIVKTILKEPVIYILDEPTNHLDIEMIEWLEDFLSRQRVTLLMVTHDRYFLDNICNKIIEIDRKQIYIYEGNFTYYLEKHQERLENLSAELEKVNNLFRKELEWMRRQPQARGSKAKYRIDNFYELEKRSKVNLSEKNVSLKTQSSYIGSKIFEANNICKSFGDKKIIEDFNYIFARYEKVGIVGPNGAGKSTFIKMLLGEMEPDSGFFDVGQTVRWGYYSQEGLVDYDEKKKVIDIINEIATTIRIDDKNSISASAFLTQFLFTPEDQQKYVYKLSGGEKRRLYLAMVLVRQPNFLVLDEPTNDLDIMTLTVLEEYLRNFKGCVIIVSHDRFFIDRIADHLFVFKGDGVIKDFPGDYSTYRHCLINEQKEAKSQSSEKPKTKQSYRSTDKPKLSFKEKREMESLNAELKQLYSEKTEIETRMSSGECGHEELASLGGRIEHIISDIDEKELRLLELMEKEA